MSRSTPDRARSPLAVGSRRRFAIVNGVGGLAVLGTYLWGFLQQPEAIEALWGGVPESVRPLYTINMGFAAAGYFLFTHYVLFRTPEPVRVRGAFERFGFGVFTALYALILFPSAAWLPLTAWMVADPGPILWWAVRFDLFAVALGSLGVAFAVYRLRDAPPGRALAAVGLLPFCLQTVVLDAVIWPAYFSPGP